MTLHHSHLKPDPFRRPQLDDTISRNALYFNTFLAFLIRLHHSPIPNYPTTLTGPQTTALDLLHSALLSSLSDESIIPLIHDFAFLLLTQTSQETLRDHFRCPFLRFLIASHLLDDKGNFVNPTRIPPDLSKLQYVFRAVGASHICSHKSEFGGDPFASVSFFSFLFGFHSYHAFYSTYEALVKPYLIVGHPCLFNTLREHMSLLSALALQEPGIPRFNWSSDHLVVSIDGFPLQLSTLITGIHATITQAEIALDHVLRNCALSDCWSLIDRALDLTQPKQWFTDKSREDRFGYSFLTDPANGLEPYKYTLLHHFMHPSNPEFLLDLSDAQQYIRKGFLSSFFHNLYSNYAFYLEALWNWFGDLSDLMDILFVAVVATWGGAARGTECDHLKSHNFNGLRHLYILNGLLTVVTTYVKTRQNTGHGKLIARALPPRVARLLIILLAVVHPTARCLAEEIFTLPQAKVYDSYIFVRYGQPMNSPAFTNALSSLTLNHLNYRLGLRDWRQLMKTVLKHIVHVDLDDDDDDDPTADNVSHEVFGHSRATGDHMYGLELTNALRDLTESSITRQQSYSLQFHQKLDLSSHFPALFPTLQAVRSRLSTSLFTHLFITASCPRRPFF